MLLRQGKGLGWAYTSAKKILHMLVLLQFLSPVYIRRFMYVPVFGAQNQLSLKVRHQ